MGGVLTKFPTSAVDSLFTPTGVNIFAFPAWVNINNIKANDGVDATATLTSGTNFNTALEKDIRLTKNGVEIGANKAANNIPNSPVVFSFGGSRDTWGTTLVPDDVNDSSFGISWQGQTRLDIGGPIYATDYVRASSFGFSIPSNADVLGVQANISDWVTGVAVRMDYVQLQVWYQEHSKMTGVKSITSMGVITF